MIDANIKKLMEFVKENPDLKVVYMVGSDDLNYDFHGYWLRRDISVSVDNIFEDDLHWRTWIRSLDNDYDIYKLFFGDEDCSDEHIKEEVDKLPWEKVIVVWIGP